MLLGIAVNGAIGAMLRFFIGQKLPWSKTGNFPLATLLINVTGSALLGILYSLYELEIIAALAWNLLGIGLFGAFTTFSTFSFELYQLLQARRMKAAAVYMLGTISLGILAAAGAIMLINRLYS